MSLVLAAHDAALKGVLVALIVVCIIAAIVYFACRAAGRPDWGSIGAAVIIVLGGLFILVDYL